jgi:predicted component of type VI protein secretion system
MDKIRKIVQEELNKLSSRTPEDYEKEIKELKKQLLSRTTLCNIHERMWENAQDFVESVDSIINSEAPLMSKFESIQILLDNYDYDAKR